MEFLRMLIAVMAVVVMAASSEAKITSSENRALR
jgi:hypothetical protein